MARKVGHLYQIANRTRYPRVFASILCVRADASFSRVSRSDKGPRESIFPAPKRRVFYVPPMTYLTKKRKRKKRKEKDESDRRMGPYVKGGSSRKQRTLSDERTHKRREIRTKKTKKRTRKFRREPKDRWRKPVQHRKRKTDA